MSKHSSCPVEQSRIFALQSYHLLNALEEQEYQEITEIASLVCGTPIAGISIVDETHQWFIAIKGLPQEKTERMSAFCNHVIQTPQQFFEVEDARQDERFQNNPVVTDDPHITFYAGVPLLSEDGYAIGSMCVIDSKARKLTSQQRTALQYLARQVMDKFELRKRVTGMEAGSVQMNNINAMLTEKEREAMQIIKHTPIAMALHTGMEMNIRFANDLMLAAWGKDESVFGLSFSEALPELAKMDFPKTMQQCLNTGTDYVQNEAHMSYIHKGMLREFYYNYAFTTLKSPDGKVWGLLNTALDVTDVVKSRLMVERAESQLRLAVQSADMGTWHIDAQTREFIPSPRLKEHFGYYPNEEMPYEAAVAQILDEHRERVVQAVEAAITKGESYDLEYPIKGYHDGKIRWLRATGRLYLGQENKPANFSGTILDITERKEEEQRKNDFIGIVSHELRSPLTSLKGYVEIIGKQANKQQDKRLGDIVIKAQRQVKRMQELISGFLDLARLGEGKIKLNTTCFDMAELIKQAEQESLVTHTSHRVIFHPVEYTPVEADQDKIEQVLINFVNNAVRYSPQGSDINVTCITQDQTAYVSVSDQGMGIPDKDQPFVFDRFYRVESEQMKKVKGFGIGLYICKEIIERHGGQIGVDSVEAEGSTFWFKLPLHQA